MTIEKQIVNNLPASLQGYANVNSLFGALGEFLDDIRIQIDEFDNHNDSALVSESRLDTLAMNFGVNYPRNLNREEKRTLIRDIVNIYRAKGTVRAIKHIFKLVGWNVELEYVWIDKNIKKSSYTYPDDYYIGTEKRYATGIYADVTDNASNIFTQVRIYGEDYPAGAPQSTMELIKTPYLKVIVTAEDYRLFTEDYVAPDGTVYSFTDTEKFNIVQDIFDFFVEKGRPANVAVIEVITPFDLHDTIDTTTFATAEADNFEDISQAYQTTALDLTANGNHGTLMGGALWSADQPNQNVTGSLSFDGVDDYVALPAAPSFGGSPAAATIEGRMYVNDLSADQNILFNVFGQGLYPRISMFSDGTIYAQASIDGTPIGAFSAAGVVSTQRWHHFAVVLNASVSPRMILYLDLVNVAQNNGTGTSFDIGGTAPHFGYDDSAATHLAGSLSDIRVWSVARTPTELSDNMNTRLTGTESGLVGYWPLDDVVLPYEGRRYPFDVAEAAYTLAHPFWSHPRYVHAPITLHSNGEYFYQPETGGPSTLAYDLTANGNDGTLMNGPRWNRFEGPSDDLFGCLSFNNSDQAVLVGNPASVNFGSGDFTLEAFFKTPNNGQSGRWLFNKGDAFVGAAGYSFFLTSAGTLRGAMSDGTNKVDINGGLFADDAWHRASLVRSGTTLTVYVDWTQIVQDSAASMGSTDNGVDLRLGGNGATESLLGEGADFRAWNIARTQQQIQDNMNTRLTGNEIGLVGYWPLRSPGVEVFNTYPLNYIPKDVPYDGIFVPTSFLDMGDTYGPIPASDNVRVKVTCDQHTRAYVFRTANSLYDISQGNIQYQVVELLIGPVDETIVTVKYATAVAVNFTPKNGETPVYEGSFEVGYHTDPILIDDWNDTLGDDWGEVRRYSRFYVPNYSVADAVDVTWDFGTIV